jgi:hypothetical protein
MKRYPISYVSIEMQIKTTIIKSILECRKSKTLTERNGGEDMEQQDS